MGTEIGRDRLGPEDVARFRGRLEACLEALARLLDRPGFGRGPATVGAELEVFLVDGAGRPLPDNRGVLDRTRDPRITYELGRFNLEGNLTPLPLAGAPFAAWEREIGEVLREMGRAAGPRGGRVAAIGILPTLEDADFRGAMTEAARYRVLCASLQERRREPFRVRIEGRECLVASAPDVSLEGANTSFQVHLRVDPEAFGRVYNAAQLATVPALAASGNSPYFLGRRLWEETRVALFKQAVDDRRGMAGERRGRARVSFGDDWLAGGVLGFFQHVVHDHPPVLPVSGDEEPLEAVAEGRVPELAELRLHNGTVWHWNRAVYDPALGGHLRVEMRALPAGPTAIDMAANGAFLLGLTLALAGDADRWACRVPFASVRHDFYRAAQHGLDAELSWPELPGGELRTRPAREVILSLVPVAEAALVGAGVDRAEAARTLDVVRGRVENGQTGAVWQQRVVEALEPSRGRQGALSAMLERYLDLAARGRPVHTWPAPP